MNESKKNNSDSEIEENKKDNKSNVFLDKDIQTYETKEVELKAKKR